MREDRCNKAMSAMLALNYCQMALIKILAYEDRIILDEEYNNIINNIRLSAIDNMETISILQQLMETLTLFKLAEQDKDFLVKEYDQRVSKAFYSAFGAMRPYGGDWKDFFSPVSIGVNLVVNMGDMYKNYQDNIETYRQNLNKGLWALEKDTIQTVNDIRKQFLQVSWELMKQYNIPEKWRLTERQLQQVITLFKETNTEKRYRELMHLKDSYEMFPPFWYMLAKTAHEMGHYQQACEIYLNIQRDYVPFFREDHEYSSALMTKIILLQTLKEKEPAMLTQTGENSDAAMLSDLRLIVENSPDDWRKTLFVALQYIRLEQYEPATVLIVRNIDRNRERSLHLRLLGDIHALSEKEAQLAKLIETMYHDDSVRYVDALYLIGKIRDRHLLHQTMKTVFAPVVEAIGFDIESPLFGKDVLLISLPDVWMRELPQSLSVKVRILGKPEMFSAEKGFKLEKKTRRVTFSVRGVIDEKRFLQERKAQFMVIVLENHAQTCLLLLQVKVEDVPVQQSVIRKTLQTSKEVIGTGARLLTRREAVSAQNDMKRTEPLIRFAVQQLAVADRCYAIDGAEQTLTECSEHFRLYEHTEAE